MAPRARNAAGTAERLERIRSSNDYQLFWALGGVGVSTSCCRMGCEQARDPAHIGAGNALMVGDHPLDVLTARRAGTWAAAVASGDTPTQDLERCGPDFLAGDAAALFAMLADAGHL